MTVGIPSIFSVLFHICNKNIEYRVLLTFLKGRVFIYSIYFIYLFNQIRYVDVEYSKNKNVINTHCITILKLNVYIHVDDMLAVNRTPHFKNFEMFTLAGVCINLFVVSLTCWVLWAPWAPLTSTSCRGVKVAETWNTRSSKSIIDPIVIKQGRWIYNSLSYRIENIHLSWDFGFGRQRIETFGDERLLIDNIHYNGDWIIIIKDNTSKRWINRMVRWYQRRKARSVLPLNHIGIIYLWNFMKIKETTS